MTILLQRCERGFDQGCDDAVIRIFTGGRDEALECLHNAHPMSALAGGTSLAHGLGPQARQARLR